MSPGGEGELASQELRLELRLEEGRLRLVNPATGARLLTPAEAQAAWRAEATARQAEATARQAEATARRAAEAEVECLRAELARRRREPSQG